MTQNKDLLRAFMDRPIAFYPKFARLTGKVTAGVFLSQLFYWTGKGRNPDGWIWKTAAEWEEETCLSRREQETARRTLRTMGIVQEKRVGIPATLHYRIDQDRLAELLSCQTSMAESANLDATKAPNCDGALRTSNTETTTETTTDIPLDSDESNSAATPPSKPSGKREEQTIMVREVVTYFEEVTGLKRPASRRNKSGLTQWYNPIREICKASDWNVGVARAVVEDSIARLRRGDLTISDPHSIIKTARAIMAERRRAPPRYKTLISIDPITGARETVEARL